MTREGLRGGNIPMKSPNEKRHINPNRKITKSNAMDKLDVISV